MEIYGREVKTPVDKLSDRWSDKWSEQLPERQIEILKLIIGNPKMSRKNKNSRKKVTQRCRQAGVLFRMEVKTIIPPQADRVDGGNI